MTEHGKNIIRHMKLPKEKKEKKKEGSTNRAGTGTCPYEDGGKLSFEMWSDGLNRSQCISTFMVCENMIGNHFIKDYGRGIITNA